MHESRRPFLNDIRERHTTDGNRLTLFTDGDAAFEAICGAIDSAERRVWVEFYIYKDDHVGGRLRDALEQAARRGCEVVVMVDGFGSMTLPHDYFDALRSAGGLVLSYNPLGPFHRLSRSVGPPSHRDHRKIVVVDDAVGFTGGLNASEEYAGEALGTDRYWDVLVRVEGPAARQLAGVIRTSVEETAGLRLPDPSEDAAAPGDTPVQVLGIDARRDRAPLDRMVHDALDRAESNCFVTTPYFVPPDWLVDRLTAAARRGVDVRLLTAGRSDVPLARMAGRHLYGHLLQNGVRIFEMKGHMLHAKYMTIDGRFLTVGSYNFDRWSARRNLEVNVAALDTGITSQLDAAFDDHVRRAPEVTLDDWRDRTLYRRPLQWLAYRLARL